MAGMLNNHDRIHDDNSDRRRDDIFSQLTLQNTWRQFCYITGTQYHARTCDDNNDRTRDDIRDAKRDRSLDSNLDRQWR